MHAEKLLILGGSGFLGHHLLPKLSKAGHRVTVLTRNRESHRELALVPNVTLRNANVHDPDTLARFLEGQDGVINLVGILNQSGGDTFESVHVELTEKLIDACRRTGVRRLLQMSALKAGQGASDYLKSRGRAEAAIRNSGLDWTLLESSVIFGRDGGLTKRFGDLLKLMPVLPLPRPHARMAPVYVDDVAEAIVRLLQRESSVGQTLELYGPETLELIDIVRKIARALGKRRWVIGMPDALGRIQASVAGLLPGKPFSRDNFLSLRTDSVGTRDGLGQLGIEPHPFADMLPYMFGDNSRTRGYDLLRQRLREQRQNG